MAMLLTILTSGSKAAAGFGVYRTNDFSLDDFNLFVTHRDIRLWDSGQQGLCIGMHRFCKEFIRAGEFQALSKIHNHNVVRNVFNNA